MTYTFTLLKSKEDCDTMISIASKNKEDLEYKKVTLEHKKKVATGSAVEIETELSATNAQIAAMDTVIASLPEGDIKKESISKKTKLEFKRFTLLERKESYGVLSLLETEVDIGCIDKDIEELDKFVAGVNERKGNL
jgi:hypothetical protein